MRSQENESRTEEPQTETMSTVKEEQEIQKDIQEEPQKIKEAGGKEEPLPALSPSGEDDVVCDSCIESPRRATKSCLTCLVSYCEAHLRPHLENPKFQSHRLVEPLRDVERRMCEAHDCPLELYCSVDACCVCQECVSVDHQGHDTLPIPQARQNAEKELQDKQTEVYQTITGAENSINKLQSNISAVEVCVQDVRAVLQQQFSVLQAAVEQVRAELAKALEGEQQHALAQAQSVRQHLEQRCTELKKTHTHLEKLAKNKNDVDFLQEYSQWRKSNRDVCVPAVCISLTDHLQSFSSIITNTTQQLCDSVLNSYCNTLKQACSTGNTPVQPACEDISTVKQNITVPEPKSREDFLKYASPLSFDSSTAHQFLRLTEDGRKVTNTTPWQHSYPERPERFVHWKQVLASHSFYQGRHYFEADISGEGVHVGVTSGCIARQSAESNGCLTGHGASWCLQWNGRGFSAWNEGQEMPISAPKSTRVGVYLDFAQGSLAFYAVDGGMTLLHRYQAELREPLYPACWLPKKENVVMLVEPGQEMPLKSPSPPCSPP
ncbi:tripartite motif-containing protein 16-like protein [Astyanax mexicanus]|uniref:Tripartite motif-containing protein 16-like protein n=1 Tax=Astyanax mexicanus TaxID=7994 RepID=A0A8T2L6D4_ASTMX|nr:tripartite motif-containing protein 16-like protein [Astyanax mexicanus]